jgi:hypothetical protein
VGNERKRLDEVLGTGYSVLAVGQPDARLVSTCRDLGVELVRVVAPGAEAAPATPYAVVTDDGPLLDWFRKGRTAAVLVRPDHVVQTREPLSRTEHSPGAQLAERMRQWAAELSWGAHHRDQAGAPA